MPEHLDARTTISRDMFYCILASKLPLQNKNKNLPPDHKISEKRTLTIFFLLGLRLLIQSPEVEKTSLYRGETCRQDPTFGSLKQGFSYIGVRYIRVMCQQITVILPGPKNVLRYNGGTSLYPGSLYRGSTVRERS